MAVTDYQLLQYLQSSGTQYIDVHVTNVDGVDMQFKYNSIANATWKWSNGTSLTGSPSIFGARNYNASGRFCFTIYSGSWWVPVGGRLQNQSGTGFIAADTNVHTFTYGTKYNWFPTLDGVVCPVGSYDPSGDISMVSTFLFAENNRCSDTGMCTITSSSKWPMRYSSSRIYYIDLYKGQSTVRELRPAKRTSDSVLGMYDIKNNVFYTNDGTGTFAGGSVQQLTLTLNASTGGSVSGGGTKTKNPDGKARFTAVATANSGYAFAGWYSNSSYTTLVSNNATYSGTATGNTTLYAKFAKLYTISLSVSPSGTGSVSGGGTYQSDTSVTIIATPNNGYRFDGWYSGSTFISANATYTFAITSDLTYTAKMVKVYNVIATADPIAGGTVTGFGVYDQNATATLSASPTQGFDFVGWYENDVLISANVVYSLTVTSDRSFIAKFEYTYDYTLTYDSTLGNASAVRNTSNYDQLTLTASLNTDVQFFGWYINDNYYNNSLSTTYVLTSNSQIEAVFDQVYSIALNTEPTLGTVSFSRSQTDLNDVSLSVISTNTQFIGWYENDVLLSHNPQYSFHLENDISIFALFEPIWEIDDITVGNGSIGYIRGTDKNDVQFYVIPGTNYHFVNYEYYDISTDTNPLNVHLDRNISITAYFEEDDKYHISVSATLKYASIYVSHNDDYAGYSSVLWARPFPDYMFVQWEDGVTDNPRTVTVNADTTIVAVYQRITDTNGIYQYRCFVKDQLDLTAPPKAFMVVNTFNVNVDLMTNATSNIQVIEIASNINEGDILVLYDPKGTTLYNGVIKSVEDKTINCSQMQSYYKGLWIYNVYHTSSLEAEIAYLLGQYAQGKIYKSSYTDPLVAMRLGGITIDYVESTSVQLPTDIDKDGNENLTQKDMEQFIYELYENYGIIFDFEINFSGANYVHIKVPNYQNVKVGNNMFAIQNMSPITTVEETNRLIIFAKDKTYRTTYVATKNNIVEAPASTANRFDITNTKVVFSDDAASDLIAANLPQTMYNHKLTFTLVIKNFLYEFGEFNLGGTLDIYHNDDYYNSVLTGYQITKEENMNITEVNFVCGKIRTKLTQMLTLRAIGG